MQEIFKMKNKYGETDETRERMVKRGIKEARII